ncbi:hypothetical protein B0H11DRAFT_2105686 [Mycena galericulata]|nr:hypothetical protein B0H11DRAFT_2105686 [Mycena galericulata]
MVTVSSSDSEDEAPPKTSTKSKPRRGRDVTPQEETDSLPPRARKPSAKQSTHEKENLAALEAQVAQLKKKFARQEKKLAARSKPVEDDSGPESEERESGEEGGVTFASSIRPLGTLPTPDQRPLTKPVLRKTKKGVAAPKIAPRAYLTLPEPTPEERALDSQANPPPLPPKDSDDLDGGNGVDDMPRGASPPRSSSPPPRSSSPGPSSGRGRGSSSSAAKRSHPTDSSIPPAKRSKTKPAEEPEEAKLREGLVLTPGLKPKAIDYAPIFRTLLIRACGDYSARILAIKGFPGVELQATWAMETFKGACRSAPGGKRYLMTERMAKIITARGSQIRGKMIETFRSLFASHYGFDRSAAKKTITSNKAKAEKLLHKMSVHYKDPDARTGYAENKILSSVRKLTTFLKKDSVGALFPSYFDPIPLALIALELSALEFCAKEWSTGMFIQAKFYEKDVADRYEVHLADTKRWSNCNEAVVETLRRKWYRRASQTLSATAPSATPTNIDEDHEDALRLQMAGRTGDTDSESGGDDDDVDGGGDGGRDADGGGDHDGVGDVAMPA